MHLRSLLLLALKSFSSRITTRAIQTSGDLPQYALVYAPIVHLWSQEEFWSSDPTIHLQHVTAKHGDFSNDTAAPYPLTIANLNYLGSGEDTYLTGDDDVENEPEWLRSTYGRPDAAGRSAASSAVIVVDKGEAIGTGYVDVFYPFFYIPKLGLRPIAYSAGGSHANYATVGEHNHSANFGYLTDHADAGPVWDITLNYVAYWYSTEKGFVGATHNHVSSSWLEFIGHWGDKQYPDSDPRQHSLEGQYRYTSGPPGPIGHNLMRTTLCQYSDCPAQESLEG
ncbi:vacuolar protein sorting protein, putative [Rhizoctonia solani AG-3 Rhs1AP]|uniref:Vacuolar protein sorting protein, putative n=2 Tax=Rhizoctonia solani AG-3 TaxID=1086053 RepID=X8JLW5_9AGAM|nr:vacuolar protein sorting protein, putative [Rhizoctonia solani AG-3 Rhs1AP]KEP50456.1 putative vacuolar protein sorting protein [Rhizoctonia solani 123E]